MQDSLLDRHIGRHFRFLAYCEFEILELPLPLTGVGTMSKVQYIILDGIEVIANGGQIIDHHLTGLEKVNTIRVNWKQPKKA